MTEASSGLPDDILRLLAGSSPGAPTAKQAPYAGIRRREFLGKVALGAAFGLVFPNVAHAFSERRSPVTTYTMTSVTGAGTASATMTLPQGPVPNGSGTKTL